MSERLDKFIELLKSKAKSWSDVMGEMPQPGLRIVKIGGDIVRNVILNVSTEKLLDQLFAQLPEDACLMDCDGQILRHDFSMASNSYCDVFYMIVASKAWEAPSGSYDIPELKIELRRDVAQDFKPTGLLFIPEPPVAALPVPGYDSLHYGLSESQKKMADYVIDTVLRQAARTWTCTNHPPGSDVQVEKGKACFCGRVEG